MKKRVAILQSNYIPWKGYFDIMNSVDEFVIYDEVQYTKNDWRNRNRIKTPQGVQWITIPVFRKSLSQKIEETIISDKDWNKKHWKTLVMNYSKSRYFSEFKDIFEEVYANSEETLLSRINFSFFKVIMRILEINTTITFSSDMNLQDGKTEKLIDICKKKSATHYLSGPAAKRYLSEEQFSEEGIEVEWMDYNEYKEYTQLYPPFNHYVSIVDMIFNLGYDTKKYMKTFDKE